MGPERTTRQKYERYRIEKRLTRFSFHPKGIESNKLDKQPLRLGGKCDGSGLGSR